MSSFRHILTDRQDGARLLREYDTAFRRLGQLEATRAKKISQNEPNPIFGHLPETEQQ